MMWGIVLLSVLAWADCATVPQRNSDYGYSWDDEPAGPEMMRYGESLLVDEPAHHDNLGELFEYEPAYRDEYEHLHGGDYDLWQPYGLGFDEHHHHMEGGEDLDAGHDQDYKYNDVHSDMLVDLHHKKALTLDKTFFKGDRSDPRKTIRKYSDQHEYPVETPLLRSNETLRYELLRNCPHGRHLLLVTLLEGYDKECWKPRCLGHIKFYLPHSLKTAQQPATPQDACTLQEVSCQGKPMTRTDILKRFNDCAASKVGQNKQFSRFFHKDVAAVNALVKLALEMDNFDSLLSFLVVVRNVCNRDVYIEAVLQLIQIRSDVGYVVPNLQSIRPKSFFPVHDANEHEDNWWDKSDRGPNPVRTFSFKTTHRTYPASDPESHLWHLREDVMTNSMHGIWHILISDPNAPVVPKRRGELFYHMHKQMLNRYNADRMGVGMRPVTPYRMSDWSKNVMKGYNSLLGDQTEGSYFPPRLDGQRFTDIAINNFTGFVHHVRRSVRQMRIGDFRLGYSNGVDHGINILADTVEPYPDNSLADGASLFHNYGHVQISEMSRKISEDGNGGVMGFAQTAMRDPVFYKWHKFTDDLFVEYKKLLGPYSDWDLSFPGVDVVSMSITSGGKLNRLRTFTEFATLELDEFMMSTMNGTIMQFERVNHDPYVINIRLHSQISGGAIGRIFMIPTKAVNDPDMIETVVEMDKFYIDLNHGVNTVSRRATDSPIFTPGPPSLRNLQSNLLRGMSETDFNWANCGWPIELAVPKGNSRGQRFELVLVVSKLLPTDRPGIHEWESLSRMAWGMCGMMQGTSSMPDSRPMGYPFDRPTTLRKIIGGKSNMMAVPVHIHHSG